MTVAPFYRTPSRPDRAAPLINSAAWGCINFTTLRLSYPTMSAQRPQRGHPGPSPSTQRPRAQHTRHGPHSPSSSHRPQRGHLSPPPSTQRPRAHNTRHGSHSPSSSHRSSGVLPSQEDSSRSSSPPGQTHDDENSRLRRKISALEGTISRIESPGVSSKRRYEYVINTGVSLTFDLIHPARRIQHLSPDVESVGLWIYITIYSS